MLKRRYDGLISIVEAEIYAGLLLDDRIEPAIVDSNGDQRDLLADHRAGCNGCILRSEVRCKFWPSQRGASDHRLRLNADMACRSLPGP